MESPVFIFGMQCISEEGTGQFVKKKNNIGSLKAPQNKERNEALI